MPPLQARRRSRSTDAERRASAQAPGAGAAPGPAPRRDRRAGRADRRRRPRRRPGGGRVRVAAAGRAVVLPRAARPRRARRSRRSAASSRSRGAARAASTTSRRAGARSRPRRSATPPTAAAAGSSPAAASRSRPTAARARTGRRSRRRRCSCPEVALARCGDEVTLTLAALAPPDDTADGLLARVERRLGELRRAPLPLLDPDPVGRYTVAASTPPEHYEAAVARAVERIRAGALEKIVLAREVQVHAPAAHDAAAVFGVLREAFPSCFCFCVGRGEDAFVAASPELLIRREGMRASTLALAGSTRRSADPAVDDHLGEQLLRSDKDREEQAIVARRIERALRPHSVWVATAEEPRDRADGEHPAPRDPDPRAAAPAGRRCSPRRAAAPDAGRRRRAVRRRRAADPGARGPRPRLVRGSGRLDGHQRGRRVLRRTALRAAERRGRPLLRRRRRRARLRSRRGARRDRRQARRAAARSSRAEPRVGAAAPRAGWHAACTSPMLTPSGSVSGEIDVSAGALRAFRAWVQVTSGRG